MNGNSMLSTAERYALERSWAVVGASGNTRKFGNRIYKTLRAAGYQVWPVNHRESEIEGDLAFARLPDLPKVPTVVNLVIPPPAALEVVRQAIDLGVRAIWFQPGAENAQAKNLALDHDLDVIEDCILVRQQRFSQEGESG